MTLQTADRALQVLQQFRTPADALSVTEIAERLGIHRSTASRLVSTLRARGFLERTAVGDLVQLGPEVARLGRVTLGEPRARDHRPSRLMERLAAETGETVTLAVVAGDEALTVAQAGGSYLVSSGKWVGLRTPIHCTADGKVLLAFARGDRGARPARTPHRPDDRRPGRARARARRRSRARLRGLRGRVRARARRRRRAGLAGRLVHRRALRLGAAVPARPRRRPRAGHAVRRVRERARAIARRIVRRSAMNTEVFITCAVTGAGDTAGRSERVPVTPEAIADAAIEAARAGAAIVHIHVRDPETGRGSRDVGALPRGGRARARRGRRRRAQPHRRHGRRPRARRRRRAAAARPRRHRHGRRGGAARARRRAAARDLHARLRHDELRRRRRLRDGQHAGHAARDGRAHPASSACGPSSRCSTAGTSSWSTS